MQKEYQINHIARLRCDECGNKHYEVDGDREEYNLIYSTGLCTACTPDDND